MAIGKGANLRPEGMSDEEFVYYKWSNIDYRVRCAESSCRNAQYFLDAFPRKFINFGPGSLAPSIGGNFQYAANTIWFDQNPVIRDWKSAPRFAFNAHEELWQKTLAFTDAILDTGMMYASVSDLGGTMDIIASLRGTNDLLFDLYDYPEEINALRKTVQAAWKQAYTILADRILARVDGTTSWMPVWCRDRYSPLQCDFSAMISPDMFEEFILPDLIEMTEFLDKSIYHMDGIDEIPHLDHLLSIPRLNAIQWTSVAGHEDVADPCWFEMYDKIQAAGKGLVLFVGNNDLLEPLLKHLSPKGVFLSVGAKDEYEAKQISHMIESIGLKK